VRMSKIFGAPFGAVTSLGKSLTDSLTVRPIVPPKGRSGLGGTSCAHTVDANTAPSAIPRVASTVSVFMVWFSLGDGMATGNAVKMQVAKNARQVTVTDDPTASAGTPRGFALIGFEKDRR